MMKYRLHIASLAMAILPLLTSCLDSYPVLEFPVDDSHVSNEESLHNTPIMVFINPQRFFSVSATRAAADDGHGSGLFDADDAAKFAYKYRNSDFYVYAFRTGEYKQGPLALEKVDYGAGRWNPATQEDKDGKSCLVDGPGRRGLRARLTDDQPGALSFYFKNEDNVHGDNDFLQYDRDEKHEYVSFFSTRYQDEPYNFFGYYIDNIDSVKMLDRSSKDCIRYRFDIDGSQDLLCGYAPFSKEELDNDKNQGVKGLSTEEYNKILNIGGFSTYAAHRSVYPEIRLDHQLVRFDFKAYPGGSEKNEEVDNIRIDSIGIECPVTCTMTVAGDTSKIGTTFDNVGWLYLREASEDGIKATKELEPVFLSEKTDQNGINKWSCSVWHKLPESEKIPYKIGGCLMVPQTTDGKYKLEIRFSQRMWNKALAKYEFRRGVVNYTLALSDETPFRKGHVYPISIAIYGYENIKIYTGITPWIEGSGNDIIIGEGISYDDYNNGEGQVHGQ